MGGTGTRSVAWQSDRRYLTLLWKAERAGDGIRTHDNDVGNVVLYQLSYTRLHNPPASAGHHPLAQGSFDKPGVLGL